MAASLPVMGDVSGQDVASGDTFPVKLHKLLHQAEQCGKSDIVSWLPEGKRFKVHDKERFAKEIMPQYFASSTYKSFQRSKNLWGFQTISKGVHKGECSHELFVRGNVELCRKMVRVRIKSDDVPEVEDVEQVPVAAGSSLASTGASASGIAALGQGGNNLMQQAFLGNLSGLNASLLLSSRQQPQQQQPHLGAFNSLLSSASVSSNNPLLLALAAMGNGSGNGNPSSAGNLFSALQSMNTQSQQAPAPSMQAPVSALQQLLQFTSQPPLPPPPQQQGPSAINQQILALLALQQQQQQQQASGSADTNVAAVPAPTASGVDLSALSTLSEVPKPSAVAAAASSPKLLPGGKEKSKSKHDKSKKSSDVAEKTNSLRDAALQRGSKVVACRARGMAMDHNMHVSENLLSGHYRQI
jgi:hypothetical protein